MMTVSADRCGLLIFDVGCGRVRELRRFLAQRAGILPVLVVTFPVACLGEIVVRRVAVWFVGEVPSDTTTP